MASTGYLAARFNVSPQTIRVWCEKFEEFLSEQARPEPGEEREFTEEDIRVITLIAQLRSEKQNYKAIATALKSGQRASLTIEEQPETEPEEEPQSPVGTALVSRLRAELAVFEDRASKLEQEREKLQAKLDREQVARVEAEKQVAILDERLKSLRERLEAEQRAAIAQAKLETLERAIAAETELEMIRRQQEQENATEAAAVSQEGQESPTAPVASDDVETVQEWKAEHPPPPSWWRRLLGRR